MIRGRARATVLAAAALFLPGVAADVTMEDIRGKTAAECESIRAAHPEDIHAYLCFYMAASRPGQLDAARAALGSVLAADPAEPRAALYAGLLAVAARAPAEPLLRTAVAGFERERDALGEVWARISLGWNLYHTGRKDEGRAEIELALEVARAGGDEALVAEAELSMGWIHQNALSHAEAWLSFRSAARVLLPDGPWHLRVRLLDGLGATAWALGRYEDALEYYRMQLEGWGGANPAKEADVLGNMTLVARRLVAEGRLGKAEGLELERRTLEAAQRAGNREVEARARIMLAESLTGSDESLAQAERALELARGIEDRKVLAWALWVVAEQEAQRGPAGVERALALVAESEAIALDALDPEALARARLVRSVIHWNDGARAHAIEDALGALDWIERIRGRQSDLEGRARVFARFAHAYRRAAVILLDDSTGPIDAQDVERAFGAMERLRARLLLDRLDQVGLVPEQEQSRDLSEFPSSADVRATLDPEQAVISYRMPIPHRAEGSAFVLTRSGMEVLPLTELDELDREVNTYLALVERRDGSGARGAARLYRALLAGPLGRLPAQVRRIVIVPDGALHRLPFGSLADESGATVAERYEITIAPSHAAWVRWKRERPAAPTDALLAFADPELGGLQGYADFRSPERLGRLPHARLETAALRRALGGGASRVLTGAQASEAALKQLDLGRYRVLHFATHAWVDERNPDRSAVLLAGDSPEDGALRFGEIVELGLRGPVIVLSACRSGAGPVIGGDGAMGLAHAFFLGGSRTVVASLWPLRDDEASELFGGFAAGLARGLSVSGALARAQRETIARGGSPAAWAGVVVLGDGDHVPFPGGASGSRPVPWALVATVAAGLLAAWVLATFSRRG